MFQQHDPCVHLSPATIHLASGSITYHDGDEARFTKTEYKLVLCLLEKALVSRTGYLPAWYLIGVVYPDGEEPNNAPHALHEHISNIRRKLKNPTYLKTLPGMGYQLDIPHGCCTASVHEVQQLIEHLLKS